MNSVTQYHDEDDDGFGGSPIGGARLIKGAILRWNETAGWTDRDGLRPPETLVVLACSEALQRWQNRKPAETITAKPLPDLSALNEAVPVAEWEPGLDGRPKPPWVHQEIVYLIDPATAGFYTYLNSTTGARIAVDALREKVITMRALRGAKVVPLVKLGHRPMKTNFGMKNRPEFEVIGWRNLGGDNAVNGPQTPQISGSATPVVEKKETTVSAPATPEVKAASAETLAAMGGVSEPSFSEILNDEVPFS